MIQIQDIKDAHARIKPYIHHTPILQSSLLNQWLGHELFFKAECLQKIGEFKARGALNTVSWMKEKNITVDNIVAVPRYPLRDPLAHRSCRGARQASPAVGTHERAYAGLRRGGPPPGT